jgi:hypothetical protein
MTISRLCLPRSVVSPIAAPVLPGVRLLLVGPGSGDLIDRAPSVGSHRSPRPSIRLFDLECSAGPPTGREQISDEDGKRRGRCRLRPIADPLDGSSEGPADDRCPTVSHLGTWGGRSPGRHAGPIYGPRVVPRPRLPVAVPPCPTLSHVLVPRHGSLHQRRSRRPPVSSPMASTRPSRSRFSARRIVSCFNGLPVASPATRSRFAPNCATAPTSTSTS